MAYYSDNTISYSIMSDIDKFVSACRDNHITSARQLLTRVDINGMHSSIGWTGLMKAMMNNHLPIVRMLLDHPNILGKLHR